MIKISIDRNSCTNCGACVDICYAREVFEENGDFPIVAHPEICRLCGHCISVCPSDSITHEKISIEDCPSIDSRQLPTIDMMVSVFRARRSYRRYRDRPVPREIIQDLISHSRWIPTGHNRQFIDWVVLDNEKDISELLQTVLEELKRNTEQGRDASSYLGGLSVEDIDQIIGLAVNKKRLYFFNAPVVLAGFCEKNAVCAREEATYAAYNITLAAERMGLGTCHIGSIHLLLEEFSHLQHELLGIPENKEIHTLLTLGYPVWRFRRMVPRRMPNIEWNPMGAPQTKRR